MRKEIEVRRSGGHTHLVPSRNARHNINEVFIEGLGLLAGAAGVELGHVEVEVALEGHGGGSVRFAVRCW